MEDAGKFAEAIELYRNDASLCLKQASPLKAALGYSAAGSCLIKAGDLIPARKLFQEAAMIYEEHADSILGKSIRESLWSLEEAYEHFLLAGNEAKSEQVYHKYVSLTTKVDPFSGEVTAMQKLESKFDSRWNSFINASQSKFNFPMDADLYLKETVPSKVIPQTPATTKDVLNDEKIRSKETCFSPRLIKEYSKRMLNQYYEKFYHSTSPKDRDLLLMIHAELRARYDEEIRKQEEKISID